MKFLPTNVDEVTVIEGFSHRDDRGSFRRLWCRRESLAHGIDAAVVQASLSQTRERGTLRGMHFQLPPSKEDKIVHCLQGKIYDVALDLRENSRSFLAHFGVELVESEPRAVFIPAGCAHGFLTLSDDCAVLYMMTDFYDPELARGVRWNDPAFSIGWPSPPKRMAERDANYPDFDPEVVRPFTGHDKPLLLDTKDQG